ncbi:hypothetical protein [Paraburkholderia aromaticivorans]|uniref:hypothetical protein n=1 Tax=Paraburkholderia aromaticivorans TaxID=2026199 RepID=UPI001455FEC2|nr:hypothetical protein [Paraburkholderia aromaticivorans]
MDEPQIERPIARFARDAINILTPPRPEAFMARLDFECRRASSEIIGHYPDADGMALAQHVILSLRIDGDLRLGIRTAFMWFTEKILDDEMDAARVRLRDALLGRIPHG